MGKYDGRLVIMRTRESGDVNNVRIRNMSDYTSDNSYMDYPIYVHNPAFFYRIPLEFIFNNAYKEFIQTSTVITEKMDIYRDYFIHFLYVPDGLIDAVNKLEVDEQDRFIDIATRRKTKNPIIIFRRYKLYSHNPRRLPYANFITTYMDGNCLFEFLKDKLHDNAFRNSHKISLKSIEKFFQYDKSIDRLCQFVEKYKIRMVLFNIFGKVIKQNDSSSSERHRLIAIIYDNHIYPYKDNFLPKKGIFTLSEDEHDVDNFYHTKVHKVSALENAVIKHLYKSLYKIGMNFNYEEEQNVLIKSAVKYFSTEKCLATCYDLKNAYSSSLSKYPNNRIGIFSTQDTIETFNQNDKVYSYAYYFISRDKFDKLQQSNYRYSSSLPNIFLGYELEYLIKKNIIEKIDITHVKKAVRFVEAKEIIKILEEGYQKNIDLILEHDKTSEKKFNTLYNGLLGKRFTHPISVSITTSNNDDIELLEEDGNVVFIDTHHDTVLKKKIKKERYLHINSRNIYDYVIAITNLRLYKFIDHVMDSIPLARLLKIKTDEVVFQNVIISNLPSEFHEKDVVWIPAEYNQTFIDPFMICVKIEDELNLATENLTIYTGPPGSGKTWKMKHYHDDIDYAAAMTNVCCRNVDTESLKANTLYSTLKIYDHTLFGDVLNMLKGRSLWIDEFSMVNSDYWNLIYILAKECTRHIYLTGDPKQIPPIDGKLRYKSLFFRQLLRNQIFLIREGRNEQDVIDVRKVIEGGDEDAIINALIPHIKKKVLYEINIHLCATNDTRQRLNSMMLDTLGLTFDPLTIGLKLLGKISKKSKCIYKGMIYTVASIDKKVTLKDINGNIISIGHDDLNLFDLGYAMTIHSVQGLTIEEDFAIHEIERILDWETSILYTAITRGRTMNQIYPYFGIPIELKTYKPWNNPFHLTYQDRLEADD